MVGAHYFRGPNLMDAILADYEIAMLVIGVLLPRFDELGLT
jgi:hypothetical protein